jgi:hypothetical protein
VAVPVFGLAPARRWASIETVKKLFSMFPSGPPGVALLLLRLCLGGLLFVDQAGRIAWPMPVWLAVGSVLAAAAVAVGFLTPFFALVCGVLELAALAGMAELGAPWEVLNLILAIITALLGPGAYSIDAWMFGRRVVVMPPRR